jgi:hypothetical protein
MKFSAFSRYLTSFSELVEASRPTFQRYFWIGISVYGVFVLALGFQLSIEILAGAVMISLAALAPWYLWVKGKAKGLPIWPIFSLTALWAYALPLLTEHPIVAQFPPDYQFLGALVVTGFLMIGTLTWLPFVRLQIPATAKVRVLPMNRGRALFFLFLGAGLFITVITNTGSFDRSGIVFPVVRAFALGLSNLSIFYFGYQLGAGQLGVAERLIFVAMLFASLVISITSMLLVSAMSMLLLGFISYFLGRGRIPWTPLVLTALLFYFLHAGKSEQREQYLIDVSWRPITLLEYPRFFSDWFVNSAKAIGEQFTQTKEQHDETRPHNKLWERSSLMHLFLYIQHTTPSQIPYLNGQSYSDIPELLVPRFLLPGKADSNSSNKLLALHYGIIEVGEEDITSVGFGLICEAFANFGYLGCVLIPIALGIASGWITRWSMSAPIMSFRFLFGVLCLSSAFQVEYTAGVLVSSLFQSTVALGVVAIVFMQVIPIERVRRLMTSIVPSAATAVAPQAAAP